MGAVLLTLASLLAQSPPDADQLRTAVDSAVHRGSEWLKARARDGLPTFPKDWAPAWAGNQTYREIVLYAVLASGERADGPEVAALLGEVRRTRPDRTYGMALRALALRASGLPTVRREIADGAQYLLDVQDEKGGWYWGRELPVFEFPSKDDPDKSLLLTRRRWGAGEPKEKYGISYSHYALLGLAACKASGVEAPREAFALAEKFLSDRQNSDGGWGYALLEPSKGSMTAGSIAALAICLKARNGNPIREDPRIQRGLTWLARNYSFDEPHGSIHYYTIQAIETAGSLSGVERFGECAWYPEGARWLLAHQNRDGSWGDARNPYGKEAFDRILDTCFAILFLRRSDATLWSER